MKILLFTKQQFMDGVTSNKIDIRPTNVAYIKGIKYKIEVNHYEDKVELEELCIT